MNRITLWAAMALLMAAPMPVRAADLAEDIVQLSEDTYVIRRKERSIFFAGTTDKQRKKIFKDASDFAAGQGKVAVEVAFNETEHPLNEHYGFFTWEYQFRLADGPAPAGGAPGPAPAAAAQAAAPTAAALSAPSATPAAQAEASPEDSASSARSASAGPPPSAAQATTAPPAAAAAAGAVAASQAAQASTPDGGGPTNRVDKLYEQLMKLDELRRKGLLTDAEFEAEKQKVLSAD